jgi:hypothetical protein
VARSGGGRPACARLHVRLLPGSRGESPPPTLDAALTKTETLRMPTHHAWEHVFHAPWHGDVAAVPQHCGQAFPPRGGATQGGPLPSGSRCHLQIDVERSQTNAHKKFKLDGMCPVACAHACAVGAFSFPRVQCCGPWRQGLHSACRAHGMPPTPLSSPVLCHRRSYALSRA